MIDVYKANFEFQTAEDILNNVASSTEIQFQGLEPDNANTVLRPAMRWFVNRRSNVPEHFARLCAVSICGQRFGFIGVDGNLASNDVVPFIEWKIDANPLPDEIKLDQIGWDVGNMTNLMRRAQGL